MPCKYVKYNPYGDVYISSFSFVPKHAVELTICLGGIVWTWPWESKTIGEPSNHIFLLFKCFCLLGWLFCFGVVEFLFSILTTGNFHNYTYLSQRHTRFFEGRGILISFVFFFNLGNVSNRRATVLANIASPTKKIRKKWLQLHPTRMLERHCDSWDISLHPSRQPSCLKSPCPVC